MPDGIGHSGNRPAGVLGVATAADCLGGEVSPCAAMFGNGGHNAMVSLGIWRYMSAVTGTVATWASALLVRPPRIQVFALAVGIDNPIAGRARRRSRRR